MNFKSIVKLSLFFGIVVALGACTSVYQKAESEFDRAAYNKAIELYQVYLEKNPNKAAQVNYKIAESYRRSNRISQALPFYQKVQENGADALSTGDRDTLKFYTAVALKANQQYEAAKVAFQDYVSKGTTTKLKALAQSEIDNYDLINALSQPNPYVRVDACAGINSESSDFAPIKLGDKLIFSSDRKKEATYEGTGEGFYDLYSFQTTDSASCTGTVQLWGGDVLNMERTHDASATFSPDGNMMVFARSGNGKKNGNMDTEVSLYSSTLVNGVWSEPQPLNYVNSSYWDGTPFITKDGKTLYFSSNRASSKGGLDIYKATFNERDKIWANVERLGDDINTEGNEMFPFVDEKGRFFFASNGHAGLGGLDIFVQEEIDSNKQIRNVGAPINSTEDDFGLIFTEKDDKGGFFTSKRTTMNDDIYRFHLDSLDIRIVRYILRGTVEGIDKVENTRGYLSNVELDLNLGSDNLVKVKTDEEGKFLFDTSLVIGKVYDIDVNASGYLPKNDNPFSTVGRGLDKSKLTQMLTTVYFDTAFVLTKDFFVTTTTGGGDPSDMPPPEIEILYELDKDRLTPEAKVKLDNFVTFLNEYLKLYPNAKLIMGSHTDERGSLRYNQNLSQRRANSAVNYIIAKGISKDRIKAVGYGETRLKIPNAKTEEEHQLNRRTTVEVEK